MTVPETGTAAPTLLEPAHLRHVETVYRDLVMSRFVFESRLGHHLAFVRTFASPTVAGLLSHTGQLEREPHRRATDTALFMYELIHHGLDSPTGRRVVDRLNQMHHRWTITNDDYRWVLGTFAVLGTQVIDRYGWRRMTDDERQCTVDWYRELGTRMGVVDIPATYVEFERFFRDYELTHLRRTDTGDRLMAVTRGVALSPVPRLLRPAVLVLASVVVDEPARSAVGLPTPSRATTAAVHAALRLRGARQRRRTTTPPAWFIPGESHEDYPDGYTVEDLGPRGDAQ